VDLIGVIIRDVIPDQTAQMMLVEHDHVIQEIISAASDPAFGNGILPRACRTCACRLYPSGHEEIGHIVAKFAITIENHVAIWTRLAKRFPQLLHNPRARRMFRDIEMENPSAAVLDDEETIQDSEGQGRHREKVHGGDYFAVIVQENSPELACIRSRRNALEIA